MTLLVVLSDQSFCVWNVVVVTVSGILKGYDKLDNLVLDDCIEYLRGNVLNRCALNSCITVFFQPCSMLCRPE